MQLCIIGTGYVGLITGACLSEMGNYVICVDNDEEKLKKLKNGITPLYEPGLEELILANVSEGRLEFTNDLNYAVKKSIACFIAVGTPSGDDGSCDLSFVLSVANDIGKAMSECNEYKIIVDKSTVPVGTHKLVEEEIKKNYKGEFDVVSNPEFLKQGAAVDDFLKPDRVVIGSESEKAIDIMREIYNPFTRTGNPIIIMDIKSAEMTKYAANAFLATKISFANEMANISEKVGANADLVRIGMSSDKRIGNQFLFHGLGYGGSCFPKDVQALIKTASDFGIDSDLLKATHKVNVNQRKNFVNKILKHYNNDIKNKTFAVWGLSFKPRTNDMRESPAITIINMLLDKGAKIKAYDPKAMETAKIIFGDKIIYSSNSYEALENADALILITEWNEFKRPSFDKIKSKLKEPIIFDGRNQYDKKRMTDRGIKYISLGIAE
ncbi:UDP-glucose/GDP-mannose dehydrogenase family protein [Brachyspira aalborgi]|uniref:UDP-glucose dehydrogenase family protein n=1 Tax=Brachyspira aalborgi TaxID=29522 RepID=UPI0011C8ACCB|nr:UDP-glucose/GDP-mannose dehydrogenase family protein [Brachyspira aalborgi]TXJ53663.1 UDP-glucose/GDP-mannose dehydrogenase family protein [Brachyspira aalborgi]